MLHLKLHIIIGCGIVNRWIKLNFIVAKGQLISKADWRAVDSLKSNSYVRFLGEPTAHNGLSARIMFRISNVGVCHRF